MYDCLAYFTLTFIAAYSSLLSDTLFEMLFDLDTVKQRLFYEGWNFNSGNYLFTTDTK